MAHSQREGPGGDPVELPPRCTCGRGVGFRIVDDGREPGAHAARADDVPGGSGDLQRRLRRARNGRLPQLATCGRCLPRRPARALVRVVRRQWRVRGGVDVLAAASVAPRADRIHVGTAAVHRDRPPPRRTTAALCPPSGEVDCCSRVPAPSPAAPAAVWRRGGGRPLRPARFPRRGSFTGGFGYHTAGRPTRSSCEPYRREGMWGPRDR